MIHDENFWHKNFIDLNDKWHALLYQVLMMQGATKTRIENARLRTFVDEEATELLPLKKELEAYTHIIELMRAMRNENGESEVSRED